MRKITFTINETYHVYQRGNSKQIIFKDDKDKDFFIYLIKISNSDEPNHSSRLLLKKGLKLKPLVKIISFALLDNHFHFLLKELTEHGISRFMQKLQIAYVMSFNNKNKRTGGLFEGRFKAKLVDSPEYMNYVIEYINLNPISLIQKDWKEKGIKNMDKTISFLEYYPYSSYKKFKDKINLDRDWSVPI